MNADDPLIQQLGSFLSAQQAKNDVLEKHLAASEEKARINQMVHDHEERGVSTSHYDRYQMAHVFESIILPHITDHATCVYYSSNYRSPAGTRYSIIVCMILISRLFPGNYRLATLFTITVSRRRRARL